jgi:protein required for attachment to host cells
MRKTWIVLANASRARVCERDEDGAGLHDLADFVHAQSRQKGSELGFDQPGHVEHGMGSNLRGGTDLDPRTDPRKKEHERFAREIAQHLDKGVASRQCERIVLIASNPFLGEIKSHLGAATAAAVWVTAARDLTALTGRELAQRVGELLPG